MKNILFIIALLISVFTVRSQEMNTPNILWIYVDDMSGWMGCYGDSTVATPNIDMLAETGVKFTRAFMPAPVCSATRSALITGTMQTTFGLQNHRTMVKRTLPVGVTPIPELFKSEGYITFCEQKTDYNFDYDYDDLYSPEFKHANKSQVKSHLVAHDVSWLEQLKGEKFFGQIQLSGGKYQGEVGSKYPAQSRIKDSDVELPLQYPDDPILRNAKARHYEQIAFCDSQVGAIVEALKLYGLWDNTVVFFFTDHGCQMPRAKQYLYEEGTRVPLIVHWPDGNEQLINNGKVRDDLVSGIDITVSSLALAGLDVPFFMEGNNLFSKKYKGRDYVVSAKDRMGVSIDHVRSIRTNDFLYIRNYLTDRELYQPGYRDGYPTFIELRKLYAEGKLTPLQASYHEASQRQSEELYNISSDPNQLNNLALNNKYTKVLKRHRKYLNEWEEKTDDKGRYPINEEELRRVYDKSPSKCVNPEYDFLKK